MSETTNYKLYITDDASERFVDWRTQMNGTADSNMTKIDEALKEQADGIEAAQTAANNAQTTANEAVDDAALAQVTADDAVAAAKAAQTAADDAQSTADNAVNIGNAAQESADKAQATADQAITNASKAQSTADTAATNAATAQTAADAAQAAADTAQDAANKAQTTADSAVADAGGKQAQHTTVIVSLAASDWVDNAITAATPGVTATNTVFVCPVPDYMQAYIAAGVVCVTQADNALTFNCETAPEEDLSVSIVIFD